MMKILIADDEFYARKALVKKVLQVDPDAEIVGDFENGVQVMEYLEEHGNDVDIILTDVKMPEMDGLHLAQELYEQESQIEVVIVSGYNEFEYAKKAISFGVSSYLVKPVQKEELKGALDKIKRNQKRYETEVQNLMHLKTLQYLSIIEISQHEEWRMQYLDPFMEKGKGRAFFLCVLQVKEKQETVQSEEIEKFLSGFCSRYMGEWFFFKRYREYVALVFAQREVTEKEFGNLIRKMEILQRKEVSVGISLMHTSAEQCPKAYQEAVYAINQRLINGWMKVYFFSVDVAPQNLLTKDKEKLLEAAIEGRRCQQALEIASDVLRSSKDAYTLYVTISSIFNLLYRLYCKMGVGEENDSEHGYMLFSYKSDLYSFYSLEEVEAYVLQIIKTVCQEQEEKKLHYIVTEILGYISRNYHENISLGELAEHKYFMNSSYLSRLFKNEMGQTFSNYLMEFRVHKAAELLESTSLKIGDVAMLSGYNDVSHFIQYFKKIYGCTPEEYRSKFVKIKGVE